MMIRIWNGCTVVCLLDAGKDGGYSISGPAGGAENGARADIDYDPWAGYVVDHNRAPGEVVAIEPAS